MARGVTQKNKGSSYYSPLFIWKPLCVSRKRRAFLFGDEETENKKMFDSSASISEYRNAKELAREWRVSVQHVLGLVRSGRLPAHRIGGRVIIPRAGAESYLQSVLTVKAA
jgi:excisionase family DNA binding protein